jgi:glycerol kinase
MQFQADILQIPVLTYSNLEMTSAGAAYMAGLAEKFWNIKALKELNIVDRKFLPAIRKSDSDRYYRGWKKAIKSSLLLYD